MKKILLSIVSLLICSLCHADTINDRNLSVGYVNNNFLKLDQTSSQTIINGTPNFLLGLNVSQAGSFIDFIYGGYVGYSSGSYFNFTTGASPSTVHDGGPVRFGSGVPTQAQVTNDVWVKGKFEVDGVLYADGGITTSGDIDWSTGNVWYLSLTDDIDAFIASASCVAGDTIVLASGTDTITDDIDVTKAITIKGQGRGITTITCATASKNVFDISVTGVSIENLTIAMTGNSDVGVKATGAATPLASVNVRNVNITGATGDSITAAQFYDAGGVIREVNINNTGTGNSDGIDCRRVSANSAFNLNVYNSEIKTTRDALLCIGSANCIVTAENSSLQGATFDVLQATSGVLTLRNTVLVNNTTSGTITYGGTVQTSGLRIGANTLDTNEWAFLDGQNQSVASTSSPTFVNETVTTHILSTPATDDTWTGTTITAKAGEQVIKNDVCYFKSDVKFWKADGDVETTTKGFLGMATAAISADTTGTFLIDGFMRDDGDFNYTIGATTYVSLTPGAPTETIPPSAGDFVRITGYAVSADIVRFSPSNEYIERV